MVEHRYHGMILDCGGVVSAADLDLWDQALRPVSIRVLPPGAAVRLPPERLEAISDGQLFEITLEPEAGSPIGRPTR